MIHRTMKILLVTLFVLAGCSAAPTATPSLTTKLRGAVFDPPRPLADFSVSSSTGAPFTLSAYRGQIVLLYFGYLTCPDLCPTTLSELKNIYRRLNQPAQQVKVLFISVDPERDTLEKMTRYKDNFNTDFIAGRAEGDALKQVMGEFGVTAVKRPVGDSPDSYLIDHTASIFVIGPDGRLLEQYLYGTDYRDIVADVQAILQTTT